MASSPRPPFESREHGCMHEQTRVKHKGDGATGRRGACTFAVGQAPRQDGPISAE